MSLQRQLRLSDAKAVEAKAARIKDWVTNKLRELEEQNAHLKAQNAKASDQVTRSQSYDFLNLQLHTTPALY
jgi:hypothetical protein